MQSLGSLEGAPECARLWEFVAFLIGKGLLLSRHVFSGALLRLLMVGVSRFGSESFI